MPAANEVTLTDNQCLECRGPENYKKKESPPLGEKRFVAGGKSQVSLARCACVMCHVPRADAKPLEDNEFKGERLVPAAQKKSQRRICRFGSSRLEVPAFLVN